MCCVGLVHVVQRENLLMILMIISSKGLKFFVFRFFHKEILVIFRVNLFWEVLFYSEEGHFSSAQYDTNCQTGGVSLSYPVLD